VSESDKLTVTGHLQELRQRLVKSVIAVIITTSISFFFAKQIFDILIRPTEDINLIFVEMTEMFGTYMKVAMASGIALAMPFLIYQLVMFVSPALTRQEKRYVYLMLPCVAFMFLGGIAFGYFVLVPPATNFLISFGSDIAEPQIRIGNYISIVIRLLLCIGAVFETPVIILFLTKIGVITPKWLANKRKYAIVGAFILAAIITPTFDPVNQSLVAAPLIILYEMSIWISKLVWRGKYSIVHPDLTPPA
jgi:sec-independent protein translocase protein TatC